MDKEQATARLEVLAKLTAQDSGAKRSAVFVPGPKGLGLVAQFGVDQSILDLAQAGWASHRAKLSTGEAVHYGRSALWPIFRDGSLIAVIYLEAAPADFPDDAGRDNMAQIASTLRYVDPPTVIASYLSCGLTHTESIEEIKRDQLAILLDLFQGNVAVVARHLGVTRETIYLRARAAKLEVNDYRPKPRQLRPRKA